MIRVLHVSQMKRPNELMYFLKKNKQTENRTRDLHLHVVRRSDVKPLSNIGHAIYVIITLIITCSLTSSFTSYVKALTEH